MKLHYLLIFAVLHGFATGCTFFEEPINDNGDLTPARQPALPTQSADPAQTPTQTNPPAMTAGEQSESAMSPSFLVVAPIEQFPRDAQNIAVIHLTDRSTRRELALCKALMQNMPTVDVQELPANPLTVVVWPVPNDNAGANCIEMISDYEAIEITPEATRRIDENTAGPYLLTRNLPTNKRMIFDTSFISNDALSRTLDQWMSLTGSNPADWPAYRRAR